MLTSRWNNNNNNNNNTNTARLPLILPSLGLSSYLVSFFIEFLIEKKKKKRTEMKPYFLVTQISLIYIYSLI